MTQVVIIGAGIGGLTLYHALRQQGITAALYEAAPVLRAVGAGMTIPPNGMQVFARLGLAETVARRGWSPQRLEIRDTVAGALHTVEMAPIAQKFGYGVVCLHRATLHEILVQTVAPTDLHLGKVCVQVRAGGPCAEVSFADGSVIQAPIVVGADGSRSVVRQSIFPASHTRPWRHMAYRSVVSYELSPQLRQTGQILWGDGSEFGYTGMSEDRV